MPTPRKTALQLQFEKTAHMSKQQIAARKKGEEDLLTGIPLKASDAVKNNPRALKEFKRVKRLFASIGKDDELYGNIINRYCLLSAECDEAPVQSLPVRDWFYRWHHSGISRRLLNRFSGSFLAFHA